MLHIRHLSIAFPFRKTTALFDLSFSMQEGESVGIIGESGSGKSSAVQAILRLLPPTAEVRGSIEFEGEDLLQMNERQLSTIRGKKIGIAFQESGTSLNPIMTVGAQLEETLCDSPHQLFEIVGLQAADLKRYPHELSGGMKQRALLAIACASRPKLLIADEPTTALDPHTKQGISFLLEHNILAPSLLLVSHDLPLAAKICKRLLIFHQGHLIEEGPTEKIIDSPKHPYTQMLISHINL
ncbi:MAG: ABC transporter ATP-binding protein [Verrucomicrobiota bacterium]|nr:ABC transporter ATP-binding protein [Verrucomicrobiota bacterium]